jgi:pimeloyl-ACP methyl ester carboxylesterase
VLDHVGAGNSAQWAFSQSQLATDTRVCAYDRAGFGWSDPIPAGPRDAAAETHELHTLLHNAGEAGPFVLVGHSYGGRVMKLFAASYPEQAAGLVLIDPGKIFAHPSVAPEIDAQWRDEDLLTIRAAPLLSRLGVLRLTNALGGDGGTGDLPPVARAAFYAHTSASQTWDAIAAERDALEQSSAQELAVNDLGDLPLLVLSAEQPADASRAAWTAINGEAAALSRRGEHRIITGAGHMSFAWEKEYADIAVVAVREVLADARAGGRISASFATSAGLAERHEPT